MFTHEKLTIIIDEVSRVAMATVGDQMKAKREHVTRLYDELVPKLHGAEFTRSFVPFAQLRQVKVTLDVIGQFETDAPHISNFGVEQGVTSVILENRISSILTACIVVRVPNTFLEIRHMTHMPYPYDLVARTSTIFAIEAPAPR